MEFGQHIVVATLMLTMLQACGEEPRGTSRGAPAEKWTPSASASEHAATDKPEAHGYDNSVNRLRERRLEITDREGKRAVWDALDNKALNSERAPDVKLEIVWTSPSQYSWNYSIPELHDGKSLLETEYPSTPFFLERKLGAVTFLQVAIPDTPYFFYMINGDVSPYFYDSKKDVIWRLKSMRLEKRLQSLRSIDTSSKRITFSAGGGDMAAFLTVDFSDRDNSPKVTYYERYDGH